MLSLIEIISLAASSTLTALPSRRSCSTPLGRLFSRASTVSGVSQLSVPCRTARATAPST